MGMMSWLGFARPRDAPETKLPDIQDNVRDSGQTFIFGRAESGERVDEKTAMQISTVYACVRLLAESVAQLPLPADRHRPPAQLRMAQQLDACIAGVDIRM